MLVLNALLHFMSNIYLTSIITNSKGNQIKIITLSEYMTCKYIACNISSLFNYYRDAPLKENLVFKMFRQNKRNN